MKIPDKEYKRGRLLISWGRFHDRSIVSRTLNSMGLAGMLSALTVHQVGILPVAVANALVFVATEIWTRYLMKQMKAKSEQIDKLGGD
jgi:hypothetical protein